MNPALLSEELRREFSSFPQPKVFFALGAHNRQRFSKEIETFEKIDWQHLNSQDIEEVYEISPSLTAEAYLYILPNIFDFCRRWGGGRGPWDQLDFINVYLRIPLIEGGEQIYESLTDRQRELFWMFLATTSALIGSGIYSDFEDIEVASLRAKLGLTKNGDILDKI